MKRKDTPMVHDIQCQAEHKQDGYIFYCQLRCQHSGLHIDCKGRTWARFWPWLPPPTNKRRRIETRY